ncbi:hypothetical protein ACWIUH_10460 [Ursidibacter arcticus]
MELLVLSFLGLFGIAALIAVVLFILLSALYATTKFGSFGIAKLAKKQPYVERVIDWVSMGTVVFVTLLSYFVFNFEISVSYGIGFFSAFPAIIYWYFWRPEFLNKPVKF